MIRSIVIIITATLCILGTVNPVNSETSDNLHADKSRRFCILYSARIYLPKGRSYEQIWKMNDDGSNKLQLTNDPKSHNQPVMSPDCKSIAFLSNGDIWVMDSAGKSQVKVATISGLNILGWSHDSKKLFIECLRGGIHKVNVIDVNSKNVEHLASGDEVSSSADYKTFAIRDGGKIKVIRGDSEQVIDIEDGSHPLLLSPDGNRLAFVVGEEVEKENLKIVLLPSGKQELEIAISSLLEEAGREEFWAKPISWSPDGSKILMGNYGARYFEYLIFGISSKQSKYIGDGNNAIWSPDGLKIVWSTTVEVQPFGEMQLWVSHIVVYNLQTGEKKTLTSGVSYNSTPIWCIK